jgi:hypothetical protein
MCLYNLHVIYVNENIKAAGAALSVSLSAGGEQCAMLG